MGGDWSTLTSDQTGKSSPFSVKFSCFRSFFLQFMIRLYNSYTNSHHHSPWHGLTFLLYFTYLRLVSLVWSKTYFWGEVKIRKYSTDVFSNQNYNKTFTCLLNYQKKYNKTYYILIIRLAEACITWLKIILYEVELRWMNPPTSDIWFHYGILGHNKAIQTYVPQTDIAETRMNSSPWFIPEWWSKCNKHQHKCRKRQDNRSPQKGLSGHFEPEKSVHLLFSFAKAISGVSDHLN